jgi:ATP-dependent DNA helicase DinG
MDEILNHFPEGMVPRPEQAKALRQIDALFKAGNQTVAFQGPTGSGKSAVGMSLARMARAAGKSTFITTAQRVLQDQYTHQWPAPEIEPMKGRSNYMCGYDKDDPRDASKGYCRRVEKTAIIQECLRYGSVDDAQKLKLPADAHLCDYWAQATRSKLSQISLFNFHSFLFQQRLGRFGSRDLLILDECHNTEAVLLQFVQVVLSDKILQKIGIELDLSIKTADDLLLWLERGHVIDRIMSALGDSKEEGCAQDLTPTESDRLRSLLDRIGDLQKYVQLTEWIIDITEEIDEDDPTDKTRKLRARPVFVGLFAKELLFSKASQTLAMSATILNHKIWAKNLGIAQSNLGYVDIPSSFPIKNRPIHLEYAGDMAFDKFEATLPRLYSTIQRLLERHKNQRGIVHTHSERLCKLICTQIDSPRFLHLDMFPYRDKTKLLEAHTKRPDSVIVASGFHEGVDLKDDLARFQIITKIPWPSTMDPMVKARMAVDGSYLPYQAALKLAQSAGRINRHDADYGITYITDAGFEKFQKRCGWLLPKWFTEAIQPVANSGKPGF